MECGPTSKAGPVVGVLLPSCTKVIPALAKLGVASELWLGETDNLTSALALFNDVQTTVDTLKKLGDQNPGIAGFNFDLEVSGARYCGGGVSCAAKYGEFLSAVKRGLEVANEDAERAGEGGGEGAATRGEGSSQWRVTADACGR